jgi:chromosome segregation ATPase
MSELELDSDTEEYQNLFQPTIVLEKPVIHTPTPISSTNEFGERLLFGGEFDISCIGIKEGEKVSLEIENERSRAKIIKLELKNTSLEHSVEARTKEIEILSAENARSREGINRLAFRNAVLVNSLEEGAKKVEKLTAKNEKLREKVDNLECKNASLEISLEDKTNENRVYDAKMARLRKRNNMLCERLTAAEKESERKDEQIRELTMLLRSRVDQTEWENRRRKTSKGDRAFKGKRKKRSS